MATLTAFTALAVAVWLVPASIHITEWPRTGPHRIAVFGPLYRLVALVAAAWLVAVLHAVRWTGGATRTATVVAPLNLLWAWTVPYWPWLPDRLPLLLAGAGPLRWAIAVLAFAAVATRAWPGLVVRLASRVRRWPGRRAAFVASLAVYACAGLYALQTTSLGGDEPHYLVITHSLLADGDLRIENNHARGDYRQFYGGDLRPDYLKRGTNQEIYSIHAPGLSALMVPGYAVAGRTGAMLTICLFAALAALAVFVLAEQIAGPVVGWTVWAFVALTVPFVPHAWALYPEMPGAAIVAWALVWAGGRLPASSATWVWRGCCVAWLPWLHTKFSVFLGGLTLLLVWRLRREWRQAVGFLGPIALGGTAWLAFFYVIYGTVDPQVPYGSYTTQFLRFANVPRSLLGLFLDQKFGLLAYSPIYALALVGVWRSDRYPQWRAVVLGAVIVAAMYILSSARMYMWWGGSSAPARFLVPVAPLLVPALAMAVAEVRGRVITAAWGTAAAASLVMGLMGIAGTRQLLLFSDPHGTSRMLAAMQGSAPLTAALPIFTEENWMSPLRATFPWVLALAAAVAGSRLCARRRERLVWVAAAQMLLFGSVGAALATAFPPDVRASAAAAGAMALLDRFDPVRHRAFDYRHGVRLSPQQWLASLSLTFDRDPGTTPDPQGRMTPALALPPGEYQARVWFEGGDRPRPGDLQAALGGGYLLSRVEEPLGNPAVIRMSVPVEVPAVWIQLSDRAVARSVRRVEVEALDVVPSGRRPGERVVAVEAFPGRPHAYVGFTNRDAYPEHGVFWTRADARARLLLAPAGATAVSLTLHVGPKAATVSIRVGEHRARVALAPDETRTMRVAIPHGRSIVPVEVQADEYFIPAEVDSSSTDTRQLGCQVRLVLE